MRATRHAWRATPGKTLSVEVRSSEPGATAEARTTVEIPCDGTVTVAGPTELPAQSFAVHTVGDHADVSSGYAVLAPEPSLPRGE